MLLAQCRADHNPEVTTYAEIKRRLNALSHPGIPICDSLKGQLEKFGPLLRKMVQKHSRRRTLAFNRSFILTVLGLSSFSK